jgi:hypothetical protein
VRRALDGQREEDGLADAQRAPGRRGRARAAGGRAARVRPGCRPGQRDERHRRYHHRIGDDGGGEQLGNSGEHHRSISAHDDTRASRRVDERGGGDDTRADNARASRRVDQRGGGDDTRADNARASRRVDQRGGGGDTHADHACADHARADHERAVHARADHADGTACHCSPHHHTSPGDPLLAVGAECVQRLQRCKQQRRCRRLPLRRNLGALSHPHHRLTPGPGDDASAEHRGARGCRHVRRRPAVWRGSVRRWQHAQ